MANQARQYPSEETQKMAVEATPSHNIPWALAQLEKSIAVIKEDIGLIETRVGPVLCEVEGDARDLSDSPEWPMTSQVGREILNQVDRLSYLHNRIIEMLSRIEL